MTLFTYGMLAGAVIGVFVGFLACALLSSTTTPYDDDDRCDEWEAARRALQMAQREWN